MMLYARIYLLYKTMHKLRIKLCIKDTKNYKLMSCLELEFIYSIKLCLKLCKKNMHKTI